MKNRFEVRDGALIIANRRLDLTHTVAQILECHDTIIVRSDPPAGMILNRNLFAFTTQGDLLWQIEESPHGTQKDKPYVGLIISQDGLLVAANWIGLDYTVNVQNGKVAAKAFNK